jgi:RNA polymerase sigma-70 factor (ECF subfamily)
MLSFYLSALDTEEQRRDFAMYYEEHYGKCLAFARRITQSKALAEDAVHNAFMRMIRHKEKYFLDLGKRTASTIVIMVESECFNILKKENRQTHSDLDEVEPIIADSSSDIFKIVASKEAVARVKQYLSTINELNRNVFEMKFFNRKSDGEIAEITGLTKNAVAHRVHKVRGEIKEILREEGYTDEQYW